MKLLVAAALVSVTLFASPAFAQSPATQVDSRRTEVAAEEPKPVKPENKVPAEESKSSKAEESKPSKPEIKVAAEEPRPADLQSEVEAVKAENAAVRELLRKMEEQQKTLLEQVDRLQQRLDGTATADAQPVGQPPGQPEADAQPRAADAADAAASPASGPGKQAKTNERYRDGIIIWETDEDAKVPFLLKFNNNTQFRYLNTTSSNDTFTDHLGVVREVHKRNDLTVNRSMFILGGYVFDKRLRYSLTVWTSAGAASIVVAGNIGWQVNKKLTITGGYTGVPGSRSLVNTFPFFAGTDRSMADNFFRPGFTQGVWANGDLGHGVNYLAFVGNGLNTLNVSANKIDPHLLVSGSVWWEPLGAYGEPGKARNMYDDYFASKKVRIRVGTSFTTSREDRFSNLEQSNPDNTSLYNSDGVLSFSTGAFAPGVTLQKAKYRMSAIDGGLKWNGLAVNGQYYFRWLNDFEADGPLPVSSTFDHGFELSAGQFVVPRKLMLYGRGSKVFGQFGNSWEYAGGVKWYFLPTERLWMTGELMRVNHAPYSGAFTPYTAGMNGWMPMVQTVIAF
ncbi:MAG: hypothetical protein ACJ741_18015 [Pyrinomonadaceae bacterium]